MSKITRIILFTSIVMLLAACGGQDDDGGDGGDTGGDGGDTSGSEEDRTYRIGVLAPESGPTAFIGERQANALELWHQNLEGGQLNGYTVEVERCNTEGQPDTAVACTRDMLDNGADAIANFTVTASTNATMPLVADGEAIMFTPSPNIAPDPAEQPYVFQTSPTDADLTRALGQFLTGRGIGSAGVVAATDASGEVGASNAREILPEEGLEVAVERIDLEETDASTQLRALESGGAEAVYSTYTGTGAVTVINSYSQLGLEIPLVISYGNVTQSFIEAIGEDAPDQLFATGLQPLVPDGLPSQEQAEAAEEFASAYEEEYGERADMLNYTGRMIADNIGAIIEGAENPTDSDSAREFLETTAVESILTFEYSEDDHIGVDHEAVQIVQLLDGVWAAPEE